MGGSPRAVGDAEGMTGVVVDDSGVGMALRVFAADRREDEPGGWLGWDGGDGAEVFKVRVGV